ncbi:anaerobic benzoate catabolism transcriptional regulator [compost metagenome]|uniref:Transcriptional regulator with XRE-family HTH domain n=1 Tax=Variovorax boronicumulans TaxID=436515 RepID=A0AAW8DYQ6_9BURK|nr:helix-turn-helix transcriptional regulator [Variovorax boronicumulans]MDP9879697.1 transcriptional regulator with XRE-family HTH domain [Variovorax boronicumulans]MDP9910849.1 transcriptional regulator with XRE-family HTH domain [Variovorax boronicumulans]MDP9918164.1 transcriptional regulator with XRE-family HTH domain [Variovorax boronicumulans]MDP9924625.1 transcriptional regulator with XRE-family HTH domain [Variovorax boronicumulans]OEZ30312.1 XRE family transcriptional regulator [Vari
MNTPRTHSSKAAAAGLPGARDPFGAHLRHWRTHRRLSQLDLAQEAEVSTRHLSYVETGRAAPSREMVLRLAERLDVPLRERNALLVAAGFAPMYRQRSLDDPAMASARRAIDLVLKGHEPFPALAVDRHWNLVAHNALVPLLMEGCSAELLKPPINVLRLSLHPEGVAPRIANLAQWRTHLLERLQQQIAATGDTVLQALHDELEGYPPPAVSHDAPLLDTALSAVAVPFQVVMPSGVLSFISTITIFGTPVDVTLQELAVESFFPADEQTAAALTALAAQQAR